MQNLERREFLRRSAVLGAGATLLPLAAQAIPETPAIRREVTLGRTGLRIPDIGFGSSRLSGEEDVVRHALERGIRYFDSAESYTSGNSETTLGRALKGRRDEVVLTSKVKCTATSTPAALMSALEGSLARLQTDRIDIYFNHAVNDLTRLRTEAWGEFSERARAAGKIRFTGISGHGGRLIECLDDVLDHDAVDVVLVGYNFGQDPSFLQRFTKSLDFVAVQPDLPRALRRAREKGVGVVAMKTLRGGRLNDLRPYERGGATFSQAALRWVLSNPDVDSLIITMRSPEQVDEYLGASGWGAPAAADLELLERYEARNGASQCRYGCSDCAGSCPAGVPISDVLRAHMYAEDYGDLALGQETYSALGSAPAACLSCSGAPCAEACPHGVTISELTRRAAHRLGAA